MFPLLRLDRKTRDEVLRNLNPIELFNVSLCSKLTLLNVKNLIRRTGKKCIPVITIGDNCLVNVGCCENNKPKTGWLIIVHGTEQLGFQNENQSNSVINGVPFTGVIFKNGYKMETYWENEDNGLRTLIEYIEDLYGKCSRLYFNGDKKRKLIRMIDWAKNRPKPIDFAVIHLNSVDNDNENADVLDALKWLEKIELNMTPSDDFIRNDHRTYEFKFVLFRGKNWFNLQRLINTKCQRITANQTILTNADINWYIKSWMKGLDFELNDLQLEVNHLNIPLILSDIPHSKAKGYVIFNDHKVPLDFNIRRHDGTVASIYELKTEPTGRQNQASIFAMLVRR